ncbi:exodeoxyribonuclease V subunit alpha [Skermania sp. ID1734]|uniref:exodeoxyribonuclease V subunit alpha n=1 Tax=Skermania sp. ID1734 TaxID=2597516 RepID=UPI00117F0C5A|nr:exodeoxyribonuclease V subunit alpha [Skermania sp. ID1734]TSE01444.1 exodeoxyribonuclease V subunit alpha [Skermania sp. ID1734]
MTDSQVVKRATGLVGQFNAAGVLAPGDVHVALRIGQLGNEPDERVLLAAALAVRAVRSGSVCLDLARLDDIAIDNPEVVELRWPDPADVVEALRRSPLVVGGNAGPLCPLRLVETDDDATLLYLDRYFRQEQAVRDALRNRARSRPPVDDESLSGEIARFFPDAEVADRQRLAALVALTNWTTIIAGGPGTGKTHTVARILALLMAQYGAAHRIALAAPTGKAAARLQESVREQAAELDLPTTMTASTLHRLLGWRRGGGHFRYHAGNRLPYDTIVVDETSMVSLTMMFRLLDAVRPNARLILVGDPDQLASVDAGVVLGDLVAGSPSGGALHPRVATDPAMAPGADAESLNTQERQQVEAGIVTLRKGRRFADAIADLAMAVRAGDADKALAFLETPSDALIFVPPDDREGVRQNLVDTAAEVTVAAANGDVTAALRAVEKHRLLCAHREGPYGVERWSHLAREWISATTPDRLDPAQWYPGQPLLVTANDYDARIYNGDTGVIVATEDGLRAAFHRGAQPLLMHPSRLPVVHTVYAMTIHRSQGSQYDAVTVVLPTEESSLLTRELLYTAITRARHRVRILGTEAALRAAVQRQVSRASGLRREIRWHS